MICKAAGTYVSENLKTKERQRGLDLRTLVGRARGAVAGKRDLHLRSGSDRGLRLATLPLLLWTPENIIPFVWQ